jgi:hypothetical protein
MATTVARTGCACTVTIRIQFHNNSGLPDAQVRRLLDRWRSLAEVYLNGPKGQRRWRCCTVQYRVDTKFGGAATAGYHQIRFRHAANNAAGRSFVDGLAGNPPADIGGDWYDTDLAVGGAHEIGHLVGLDDEYVDTPDGSVNTNPKPPGTPQSIMGQIHDAVQFLQEHVDKSMAALGADCPATCCPRRVALRRSPPPRAADAGGTTPPAAPGELVRWGAAGSPLAQARAVQLLSKPSAVPALAEALRSEVVRERWIATVALGDLAAAADAGEIPSLLASALDDPSALVRLPAAGALLDRGAEQAVSVLVELILSDAGAIGHPSYRVCHLAEQALSARFGSIDGAHALDTPEDRLACFDAWTRWWRTREEDG